MAYRTAKFGGPPPGRRAIAFACACAAGAMSSGCSRGKDGPAAATAASSPTLAKEPASSTRAPTGAGEQPPPSPSRAAELRAPGAAPAASGAAGSELPKDANVILISIDSLRADMPWSGYDRAIAPRLTALEARAISFTRAYAASSYTSMSLGGLLGGKLPGELKRDGFFFGTYAKECVFFPELLHDAGIATVAGHAHGYFKNSGFEQGFDHWELVQNLKWNNTTDENVTSPALEGIAEKLLSNPKTVAGRFFAWFHFLDPHDQYVAHPGIGPYGKTLRDRYDAEVTFTDEWIGKLLDFIAAKPWAARTILVVTSDHGEAFGEHKMYSHGFELFENLVRVPLFFVIPGVGPRRVAEPRSALDLAPTFLDIFGVKAFDGFRGTSLVPEILGKAAGPRDIPLDLPMTSDNDRRRALVHGREKIVAGHDDGYLVLYDLDADPEEKTPLTKGDEHASMAARYRAFEKSVADVAPYGCKEETCLNGKYLKKDAGP